MCGCNKRHLYPVRTFSYHTEQAMADEVHRVIVCSIDDVPLSV